MGKLWQILSEQVRETFFKNTEYALTKFGENFCRTDETFGHKETKPLS